MAVARAKFGYLLYDDMLARIADKKLDEYDICYTKDTHECYIISEDRIPIAIKSKVYTYSSVSSAEIALNSAIDTYEGQIVAIKYKSRFRAYIVEKGETGFFVTPLDEARDTIDYDTLGNKPIVNLKGTPAAPIIVGELNAGVYYVSGQYTLVSDDKNINLAMRDLLFMTDGNGNVKKITSKDIVNYTITDDGIKEDSFATVEYIKKQGFATEKYVDAKIAALEFLTKDDLSEYVTSMVEEILDKKVDAVLDKKVDEKVDVTFSQSAATQDDITKLFQSDNLPTE